MLAVLPLSPSPSQVQNTGMLVVLSLSPSPSQIRDTLAREAFYRLVQVKFETLWYARRSIALSMSNSNSRHSGALGVLSLSPCGMLGVLQLCAENVS